MGIFNTLNEIYLICTSKSKYPLYILLYRQVGLITCVTGCMYLAHLYCLAVQASYCSDMVECSLCM